MTERSAYEILGVAANASASEVKRAYRHQLRVSHPDLGGTAEQFREVQWAWSVVGTSADRAHYDERLRNRHSSHRTTTSGGEPRQRRTRVDDRPASRPQPARSFGHPGGLHREAYMRAVREWVGLGGAVDYFDPALVERLPESVRGLLTKAIAEEATVKVASALGSAFALFNGVRIPGRADETIDHLIVGPTGVFLVHSAAWEGPVSLDSSAIVGTGIGRRERPVRGLDRAAKWVAHGPGVRVAAIVVVVRDDAAERPRTLVRRRLRPHLVLVRRSELVDLLREGVPGEPLLDAEQVFEVRDVLQSELLLD